MCRSRHRTAVTSLRLPRPATLATTALLSTLLVAACSGSSTPGPGGTNTASGSVPRSASDAAFDAAFNAELTAKLRPPPLPSFSIPTDLLDSAQDRDIAHRLTVEPGLYQGIAVLSERCSKSGAQHSADARASSSAGSGSYKKGGVEVTVTKAGTGVYNGPGIHVAVLPGGSGVYEHGDQRLSVEADGAGTWVDGDVRLTVRPDGSGSYSDADSRFWVGQDGSGGYSDGSVRVSVTAAGVVSGSGELGRQAVVKQLVQARLDRFSPVPAVRRVKPTGRVCGTVIRLDANALFDFGAADLRSDARALVDKVAGLLAVVKPRSIQVNGYTDHIGGAPANLDLSRRRARSVADELAGNGVTAGSMQVRGLGEADPLGPETTRSGADDPRARQLDRRVEIVLPD